MGDFQMYLKNCAYHVDIHKQNFPMLLVFREAESECMKQELGNQTLKLLK